ncbi:hypothetical protein [Limosilactobacillus fermentum]|uniref:hypothetical protein n=1 Tax=Limosilactobacillus fermentum TaxID=1613 RepID=UPI0021C1A30A|nr:hypothetical protein [Limosilactobacillus fermentum]
MKKILVSSLSILLIGAVLAGCGNSKGNQHSTQNNNSSLKAENSRLKENIKKNSSKPVSSEESSESTDNQNSVTNDNSNSNTQGSNTNDNSNSNTQGSNAGPIQSAQDAENLVTHSMHVNPGIYHAVPTAGGFLVSRDDISESAFVQYNGTITWDDGGTTSYGEASAPTTN